MDLGNIIMAATCGFCALIFGAIALWAFTRRDPMHFWAGSAVNPEDIIDIPAYNRANGKLWAIYAACMAVSGVFSLFGIVAGSVLLVLLCVPGIAVLIIAYKKIFNKYRRTAA